MKLQRLQRVGRRSPFKAKKKKQQRKAFPEGLQNTIIFKNFMIEKFSCYCMIKSHE